MKNILKEFMISYNMKSTKIARAVVMGGIVGALVGSLISETVIPMAIGSLLGMVGYYLLLMKENN